MCELSAWLLSGLPERDVPSAGLAIFVWTKSAWRVGRGNRAMGTEAQPYPDLRHPTSISLCLVGKLMTGLPWVIVRCSGQTAYQE